MKRFAAAASLSCLLLAGTMEPRAQASLPAALEAMADAERAFARAATIRGVRDAFLEYFAEDSLAFTPLPVSARDRLRQQPSRPFSVQGIVWEPRAGDVAASEEVGWLTGPATFLDNGSTRGYGCYLSVWRKQPDGRWMVFIDIGTDSPDPVPFAPGLTQVAAERRYRGADGAATARASLLEADRQLNAEIGTTGAAAAYAGRMKRDSRLHRNGVVPVVGGEAIAAWLAARAAGMQAESGAADVSRAGDLGYSYGTYRLGDEGGEAGPYVRIWARDETGRWLLMADVAHPAPPRQ